MRELNCLIVEDEPLAADIITDYISQVKGLHLVKACGDAIDAFEVLQEEHIDLIFLDINLPKISGIEFIKSMNRDYDIILTTAYHQYAIDGFNLNVVDYLLKPIEFSRFLKAVNKVMAKRVEKGVPLKDPAEQRKCYFINTGRRQVKVMEDDILYIESLKDYVRIHTTKDTIVTKSQIGQIKDQLKSEKLLRIHKSYIINITKITAFTATEIELGDNVIPIGRTYKELAEQALSHISRPENMA